MICLIGAQVPLLIEYYAGHVFSGVIRVHFAGGRFPAERLGDLHQIFPNAQIFNNYGCAEALPRLTLRPAEAADWYRFAADQGHRPALDKLAKGK